MIITYHKKPNNLTLKDEFIMKKEFVFFCLTSGVWFDVYNESRNNADYYYGRQRFERTR